VAVAGAGSVVAGLIQAAAGEPTTVTRVLTIFPTVLTRRCSLTRSSGIETAVIGVLAGVPGQLNPQDVQ
jgi:hypothetical protein